ncbi:aminopeptidase N [Agaribacterium haliotis]|uniref:aminopeptidase N n=1 Tax=Agaribacterium haliotis TaxID=2013869 RepID=UPI000BB53412|nr:aminopeptidase N [Agaribacterium haliotis]
MASEQQAPGSDAPVKIYLKDYQQPNFWLRKTELEFDIQDTYVDVLSRLSLERNTGVAGEGVRLHGEELELLSLALDGKALSDADYRLDTEALHIFSLPDHCQLEIKTRIYPDKNTSLEGLYQSKLMLCTQCEAEGFRKITYYLDRPDVMSEFFVRIEADQQQCPVLLANGNKVDAGELDNGRHFACWHDPHLKPSYLFALVAGRLAHIDDHFTTKSGREILLRVFVEDKDLDKCQHALDSLKYAMRWDEQVYGREYDLDIYMIVAVDDFNMGAMENKGLNIFNTSCVLAKAETSTDAEFQRVEAVVAHEYFHNWSGNRVTCRDWFQLSLKEGFTVFRDAEFSADMGSRTVKRVEDVSLLRSLQFAEDAGPMAHAVQPDSFIEISNFYTLTIYEKGAEIVRMIHRLLGPELFRKGSDLYFERHDGQAVTIEDFVAAMADVSGRDFSQFMRWYKQAATPEVKVEAEYDSEACTYTLRFRQHCRATAECQQKLPFLIPIDVGLIGANGKLAFALQGSSAEPATEFLVELSEAEQHFVFEHVNERPVPSLLRGFSAPVKLDFAYQSDELLQLMAYEDDGFCRWDAGQQLMIREINSAKEKLACGQQPELNQQLVELCRSLLADRKLDMSLLSLMLSLPSEKYLAEIATEVDVEAIYNARNWLESALAIALKTEFHACYTRLSELLFAAEYRSDAASVARRSLRNKALHYLVLTEEPAMLELAEQQFQRASNMSDELAAFKAIVHSCNDANTSRRERVIEQFYDRWHREALVMNHWFSVQATVPSATALEQVKKLSQHSAYDKLNPNKLRSLVAAFCAGNTRWFHDISGQGYRFLADEILRLNTANPQIASRLLTPLTQWRRYDQDRQALMKVELERIKSEANLSKDVFEVISKTLEA